MVEEQEAGPCMLLTPPFYPVANNFFFRVILIISLTILTLFPATGNGQQSDTTSFSQESYLAAYPLIFYFPETRLGFGAAGIFNFYTGEDAALRPSQLQAGAAYTLNRQLLLYTSYQLFLNQNRLEAFGEIGYYDYFYFYYGIGNKTRSENEETYFVRFPRFRGTVLKQVLPFFRAGVSYQYDNYNITETKVNGLLQSNQNNGFRGGVISTAGLVFRYDTRNNVNLPLEGAYYTFNIEHNGKWLGGDFNYNRMELDAIQYVPLAYQQTLALNLFTGNLWGSPPFQELFFLGGPRKGRGMIEGRFRQKAGLILQAAYRFPLFWRFRGNVFSSVGRVSEQYQNLFTGKYQLNYGAGIRFLLNEEERIMIRLDAGLGSASPQFYLTIGEAF